MLVWRCIPLVELQGFFCCSSSLAPVFFWLSFIILPCSVFGDVPTMQVFTLTWWRCCRRITTKTSEQVPFTPFRSVSSHGKTLSKFGCLHSVLVSYDWMVDLHLHVHETADRAAFVLAYVGLISAVQTLEQTHGKSKLYTTCLGDWHSQKQVQPPCHARVLENTCKQVNELVHETVKMAVTRFFVHCVSCCIVWIVIRETKTGAQMGYTACARVLWSHV